MNTARLRAVIGKELLELRKNRSLIYTVFLPPLLLTLLPLGMLLGLGSPIMGRNKMSPEDVARIYSLSPALARYTPAELVQLMAIQQFLLLYLIMPLIIPMTIAAASIIGEKEKRSLEPLLATPVTTGELLFGKSIAAVVPAMLATWAAYLIFFLGARWVVSAQVYAGLLNPMWLVAMVVLAPLLCLLSVSLGILISSRVNDARVAQQIGGALVIPIVLLGVAQLAGLVLVSATTFVAGAFGVAAVDAGVLYLATKLFQRETILTRWK